MRFQFSRRSPIAQWAVRFRTAPRLGRLSVKSDRRAQAAAMMPLIRIEVTPALSGIFIKRALSAGRKLLHCNLYREDIRVFGGFGQASASSPGPPRGTALLIA